jgi:general secretion pathway protein D
MMQHRRGRRRRRHGRPDLDRADPLRSARPTSRNRLNEVFDVKAARARGGAQRPEGAPRRASAAQRSERRPRQRRSSRTTAATRSSSSPPSARTCASSSSSSGSTSRTTSARARSTSSPLQHADAVELAKTLNEIITGAQAPAGRLPRPAAQRGRGTRSLDDLRVGREDERRQGDELHRRHLELRDFANLRTVIDQLDQPRRQVFIEAVIMDLTIDRENQFGCRSTRATSENGPSTARADAHSTAASTRSGRSRCRARRTRRSTPSRSASAARAARHENLLGTGFSIPAFGILINAMARRTTPTSSRRRTSSRRTTSPPRSASARTSRSRPTSADSAAAGSHGGAAGAAGARSAPSAASAAAARPAPGHRHQGQDHAAPQRLGRGAPRGDRGDQRRHRPAAARVARRRPVREAHGEHAARRQGSADGRHRRPDAKPRRARGHEDPALGDIPVLGALFRSSSDVAAEDEPAPHPDALHHPRAGRSSSIFERKMQERQEFLDHYFVFSDEKTTTGRRRTTRAPTVCSRTSASRSPKRRTSVAWKSCNGRAS